MSNIYFFVNRMSNINTVINHKTCLCIVQIDGDKYDNLIQFIKRRVVTTEKEGYGMSALDEFICRSLSVIDS